MSDELEDQIRRADPDRWLAARLIEDETRRAHVEAIYLFNHELARASEVSREPLVGEMRLAWWGEAVGEICDGGRVRSHPVAHALEHAVRDHGLPRELLDAMVDARLRDLDTAPLAEAEVEPYADATAGTVMRLAARVLSPDAVEAQTRHAARAWALAGLARLGGRLPAAWSREDVRRRVDAAQALARREIRGLPVAAFPAVAYGALSPAYGRGRELSELGRRARITWAALTGRI
jgi:phytoene synthase